MKVYVLHECIDSSDFYAEDNIIDLSKGFEDLRRKMFKAYLDAKSDFSPEELCNDDTWYEETEASVVCDKDGYYYRHHWKIDEFEV